MIQVGFLVLLSLGAFADAIPPTPCPNVTPMKNFDMTQYVGRWFVVEKYMVASNPSQTCEDETYEDIGDGIVKLQLNFTDTSSHKRIKLDGFGRLVGRPGEAKFLAEFEGHQYDEQWILHTDYLTTSIHFTCGELSAEGVDNVWVLARSTTPLQTDLDNAHQVLVNNLMNVDALVAEDWTKCPVVSPDC